MKVGERDPHWGPMDAVKHRGPPPDFSIPIHQDGDLVLVLILQLANKRANPLVFPLAAQAGGCPAARLPTTWILQAHQIDPRRHGITLLVAGVPSNLVLTDGLDLNDHAHGLPQGVVDGQPHEAGGGQAVGELDTHCQPCTIGE